MKLKLIGMIGATAMLAACSHHPATHSSPPSCSDYIKAGDVPPPPPGHHWDRDVPPPRPCHHGKPMKPHHDHERSGIFGTEPYKAERAAPFETRRQPVPDTGVNENYPFWR